MTGNVQKLALVLAPVEKTNRAINRIAGKSISCVNKINAATTRTNKILNGFKFKNPIKQTHGLF